MEDGEWNQTTEVLGAAVTSDGEGERDLIRVLASSCWTVSESEPEPFRSSSDDSEPDSEYSRATPERVSQRMLNYVREHTFNQYSEFLLVDNLSFLQPGLDVVAMPVRSKM